MILNVILITFVLILIAAIGLAIKYFNQKRSPFTNKRRLNLFKRNERTKNSHNKNEG